MNSFHFMQSLVAVLVILNVLDILSTTYAIRSKIATEGNKIVLKFMQWVGTTWGGLLVVKLPLFAIAAMAMFPLIFAKLGVPNSVLARIADTPTYAWLIQIAIYAVVVGNNLRIVWRHAQRKG